MSADAAPSIRPPRIRRTGVLFWTLAVLGLAATVYLLFGDFSPRFPDMGARPLFWFVAFPALAFGAPILSALLAQVEGLNVVERRGTDAVVWKLSRSARVALFSDFGFSLFFAGIIASYGWAAFLAEDWKRALAAAFVIALQMTVAGLSLWRAMTNTVTLTLDDEGVRGADLPGGGLSWDQVERVTLKQKSGTRLVGLVVDGRILWIDLEPFGITARRFLARLEDVAPQVEIEHPTGHFADLAAD